MDWASHSALKAQSVIDAVIGEGGACLEDPVEVRNSSGSMLFKTNRARPCTDHAPGPNPLTVLNSSPDHRNVLISRRSSKVAVLSRITKPYEYIAYFRRLSVYSSGGHLVALKKLQRVLCKNTVICHAITLRGEERSRLVCTRGGARSGKN